MSGARWRDADAETAVEGMRISCSGLAKRASTEAACAETGVRARFLVGRWERGSAEVGMDSGPGADMAAGGWIEVVLGVGGGWPDGVGDLEVDEPTIASSIDGVREVVYVCTRCSGLLAYVQCPMAVRRLMRCADARFYPAGWWWFKRCKLRQAGKRAAKAPQNFTIKRLAPISDTAD